MKFYYETTYTDLHADDSYAEHILCSAKIELKKDEFAVIELHDKFVVVKIKKRIEELEALTRREIVKEIIQRVESAEYLKNKENDVKRLILMQEMKDKLNDVKMLEQLKKYSDKPEMRELYEAFEALGSIYSSNQTQEDNED